MPGDILHVERKVGGITRMFLEVGPFYGDEIHPWVEVADDNGEIICAELDVKNRWIEQQ